MENAKFQFYELLKVHNKFLKLTRVTVILGCIGQTAYTISLATLIKR